MKTSVEGNPETVARLASFDLDPNRIRQIHRRIGQVRGSCFPREAGLETACRDN